MLGAFLGLIYCLVYFLLNSGYAVRAFDETVNPMFRGRVTWERVTWGPLPWRIRILGGRLLDEENDTIIYAREIRASVDLLALKELNIFARNIEVSGARVKVEVGTKVDPIYGLERAAVNIAEAFMPPEAPYDDGLPGIIPHLKFTDATLRDVSVVVDVGPAWLNHEGVEIEGARFELTPEGVLRMGARDIKVDDFDLRVARGEDPRPVVEQPLDSIYRWQARRVHAQSIDWEGLAFTLGNFRAELLGDVLEAWDGAMDLDRPGLPFISLSGRFDSEDISKHLIPLDIIPITGPVNARFKGEGEIFSVKGAFTLEGKRIGLAPWQSGPWRLAGRAENNSVFIEEGTFAAYGGQARLTGALIGEQGAVYGRVDLTGIHPERLPIPAMAPFSGQLRGSVGAQVRDIYDEMWVSSDARLWLTRFDAAPDLFGLPLGKELALEGAVWLSQGQLHLPSLRLQSAYLSLEGGGALDLDAGTIDVAAHVDAGEVRPLARPFGLDASGALTVDARLTGPLDDLAITAKALSPSLSYTPTPELPLRRVGLRADLKYHQGVLDLRSATARTAGGRITASGTVGVGQDHVPLNLKASLSQLQLDALPIPGGQDLRGQITGRVSVRGTPRRPSVDAQVTILRPRWARLAFTKLVFDGKYSGQDVKVRELVLSDGRRDLITGSGALDLKSERFDLDLDLEQVSLDLINKVVDTPVPIRGEITMDFKGGGTFDDPHGTGTLNLDDVVYGEHEGEDELDLEWSATLTVTASDRLLSLGGELSDGITLNADVPLYPDGPPTSAVIRFDDLSPDDPLLRNFIPPLDDEVFTELPMLTGEVTASGDAWSGALYEAGISLTTLETRIQGEAFKSNGPIQLVFRDDAIHIKRLSLLAAGQQLDIQGGADLEGFLDLRFTGVLDLAYVHPFLLDTFNSMRGSAYLDLSLSGIYSDPIPSGVLTLNDDAYLTPKSSLIAREIELLQPVDLIIEGLYGPNPKPGNFTIALPDRRITAQPGAGDAELNRIVIRRDDGEVYIKGLDLVFGDFVPMSMVIQSDGDNLTFNIPRVTRATANFSDLRFELIDIDRPQFTRMSLTGDIYVVRAEYVADVYSTTEIGQGVTDNLFGRARRQSVSAFERIPLLKRLEVDLLINGDNDIFVRNQVATLALDMEVRPLNVHLTGNLFSNLNIDGQVQVITDDSSITFSGREFEVIEGLVNFDGDNFLETNLRAQRNFEIRDSSTGNVGAFGPASGEVDEELVTLIFSLVMPTRSADFKPDIKFESSSGAPQIDVLSLVLTGRRIADLNAAATAQPALEVALGPLLSYFERPLEETLELDLSVVPQTTGSVEVDVDKKLGQRVRLFTRAQVGGDDSGNRITLGAEYQINNVTFGELTNERDGLQNNTTARLRFRWTLD